MIPGIRRAGTFEHLCWLVGLRTRYQVEGRSMLPCLSPGDEVLVHRSVARHIQVGDLIVADHPRQQGLRVLKRVEQVLPSGELSLVGLNSEESTDSRHFGPVSPDRVIGRVISRL